jgi:hypothetical protein
MRHYLYLLTFVGLMLVVGSGCSKPVTPIGFVVKITNNCPGNDLQKPVEFEISYFHFIDTELTPPISGINFINGMVAEKGGECIYRFIDGKDLNGDGALDSGDLDEKPPATDVLCIKLDWLDTDPADPDDPDNEKKWNDISVFSVNTIVDGCTVEVTIDANCLASYEIKYPASDGTLGSSTESGVFQPVERTVLQDIDEDSSR